MFERLSNENTAFIGYQSNMMYHDEFYSNKLQVPFYRYKVFLFVYCLLAVGLYTHNIVIKLRKYKKYFSKHDSSPFKKIERQSTIFC